MASAAAAIDQAATPKPLDESLWWDSFVDTLEELEAVPLSSKIPDSLSKKVLDNHKWFLDSISRFKPPNQASRLALDSSNISIGTHQMSINDELKETAFVASSKLSLDEVQSYILAKRCVTVWKSFDDYKDGEFFNTIMTQYYLERQCLLKIIRWIFAHALYTVNELQGADIIQDEAFLLMKEGLEEKLLSVFESLLTVSYLDKREIGTAIQHVEGTLIEENLILDILFLAYYDNFSSCSSKQWRRLCVIFKGLLCNLYDIGKLEVSAEARCLSDHLRVRLVILLIEAMDLEGLLRSLYDETPFRQDSSSFSDSDILEMDAIVSDLTTVEAVEAGPLVLAWAVFLCLFQSLLDRQDSSMLMEIDHVAYARHAFKAAPFNYIISVLHCSLVESDSPVSGFLSVLRTFISSFVAAYEITYRLGDSTLNIILDIICEIYRREETLCMQFWDKNSFIDGPIRSLLCLLESEFPFCSVPFIKFLSSVCGDAWSAKCVYNYLANISGITSLYHIPGNALTMNTSDVIVTPQPLPIPGLEGLTVPSNTRGQVLKVIDRNSYLVRWQLASSGVNLLLLRLAQDTHSISHEEKFCAVDLLYRMVSFNTAVCFILVENCISVPSNIHCNQIGNSLRIEPVKVLCNFVHSLMNDSNNSELVSMCINIFCEMLKCLPSKVSDIMLKANFLGLTDILPSSGVWLLSEGLSRMLVADSKESSGVHPLTISVLDYTTRLLKAGAEGDVVSGLLIFSLQYILVNHENWNYCSKYSRWNVTLKVFHTMNECIKLLKSSSKLGAVIHKMLFGDSSVYNTVFRIFSLMSQTLERLYVNHLIEMREVECLQLCVHSALDALFSMFSELMKLEDVGTDTPHLMQILLSSKSKPVSLFEAAISLLSFSHDPEIQVAASKVLTRLCDVVVRTKHYTNCILPSITDEMQFEKLIVCIDAILTDRDSSEVLVISLFDLLVAASRCQPALFFSMVSEIDSSEFRKLNLVDTMLKYISKSGYLIESAPGLLFAILNFVKVFWEGETQYVQILDTIRGQSTFWENLASVVLSTKLGDCPDAKYSNSEEMIQLTDRLKCQAIAMEIMAHDIFLIHKVPLEESKNKPLSSIADNQTFCEMSKGVMDILSSWYDSGTINGLICLYSSENYINEIVHRAKMSLSTCLVHLMVNLSRGDAGSLCLSLVRETNSILKKLIDQPAFSALLAQYALCGYSKEGKLHDLVLNDLYYHLDGELHGREIAHGPFKELEQYLLQLELFQKEQEYGNIDLKTDSSVRVFNTYCLKAELGLEFWDHSTWKASKRIADEALGHMHGANLVILFSQAKHSALNALNSMLYVYDKNIFTRTSTSDRGIPPEVLLSCVEKLCQCLRDTEDSLLSSLTVSQISTEHYVSKIDILLNLCRSLLGRSSTRIDWKLLLPTCVLVIRTSFRSLKLLRQNMFLAATQNKATNFFLLLLIICFEFLCPLFDIVEKSTSEADLLSEASQTSLSFLPVICKYVESSGFCNASVVCLELIIKGLVSPKDWLPILQKNLNLQFLMQKAQVKDATKDSIQVTLRFLLTISQTKGGAKMLQSANLFSSLKVIFNLLAHDTEFSCSSEKDLDKTTGTDANLESILGLGLAVVTSMILSMDDDDSCIELVDSAISYFFVENMYMTYHCLSASSFSFDDRSKKRLRTQGKVLCVSSLKITELTIMLFCALAKHDAVWAKNMKEKDSELREECIHMLAFISKGTLYFREAMKGANLLLFSPMHKGIEHHEFPSLLGCKGGWFGLITHSISDLKLSASPNTSLALVTKDCTDQSFNHLCLKYSDLAALHIYKIAFLLLKFLCIQATKAAKKAEDLEFIDLAHFPELPMPDILHGIQDQCIAIVSEVCIGNKSKEIPMHVESTCLLLLQVLEKSLYLEFCVSQSCGIRPVLGRVEDFSKETKQLLQSAGEYSTFKGLLKSLRQIIYLVYPGITFQTEQNL